MRRNGPGERILDGIVNELVHHRRLLGHGGLAISPDSRGVSAFTSQLSQSLKVRAGVVVVLKQQAELEFWQDSLE